MVTTDLKRKLAAILSADVVGYSRLMEDDDEATVRTITAYREVVLGFIQGYHGRVVDAKGDNILAEFPSVLDAVSCGVAIQKEIKLRNADLSKHRRMEFRIGINLGDIIEQEEGIYGNGVNIAARLEALAEPGDVLISGTVHDQVEGKLDLGYEFQGERQVKNIAKKVKVYRVVMEPETGPPSVSREFEIPEKPSIAVLPFSNMSRDAQQDFVADGITENIITALAKIPEMLVIARNSVFIYKGKSVKVQQVKEQLGVRYILEGSVLKAGDRVRITGQLVDAAIGHHLWAENYDGDVTDLFGLLDEITREIVIALQVELTAGEQARLAQTPHLKAWGNYVRGVSLLERFSEEDNARAREFFERAVEIAPDYAAGWTMLAWTHFNDARWGWMETFSESVKLAVKLVQKAISFDDMQPLAQALLGNIYLLQRKHDQAIAAGKKALKLGPNSAETAALVAEIMRFSGMFEEAVTLSKKAIQLQPYYPAWYLVTMAMCYYYLGLYEDAIATTQKSLQLAQASEGGGYFWGAHVVLAMNFVRLGKEDEARAHAKEVLRLNPKFSYEWDRKWSFYREAALLEQQWEDLRRVGLK